MLLSFWFSLSLSDGLSQIAKQEQGGTHKKSVFKGTIWSLSGKVCLGGGGVGWGVLVLNNRFCF